MASPPIHDESVLQHGFRFEPKPRDIVTYYLPRLIAGEPMHAALRPFLHHADIYACAPGALAARFRPTPINGDRFFFTAAKRQKHYKPGEEARYVRVAGPGSWSLQKGEEVRDAASKVKVGEVRKLRYVCRSGVKTDWLMEEYSCACTVLKGALVGLAERVFCRIYVSPNAGKDSAARQESAAFVAPVPPEPVVAVAPAASKRPPAPLLGNPPCPKRIRGAPVSPRRPPPAGSSTSSSEQVQITRRPSMPATPMVPVIQPGRSPAPATPRPSPSQQQSSLSKSSVSRQLPSRPAAPPAPPPVEQAPLTPQPGPATSAARFLPVPFASPDHHLLSAEDQHAQPEDDDFQDLINHIESSVPTTEADDDMDQFASSLDDILDVNEEGHQVLPPQKVHKLDPFEAAWTDDAE